PKLAFTTHILIATKPLKLQRATTLKWLITELSSPKITASLNAALSGEQRRPLNLKHCAVNTKVEANQKCRAFGIRLKCLVSLKYGKRKFGIANLVR
ncbi:hypothetical protein A1QO_17790, partial [Vibrio genomosp. F10 str. ZF-129]